MLFVIQRVTGSISLFSEAGSSSRGFLVLMRAALSLGRTLPWVTNKTGWDSASTPIVCLESLALDLDRALVFCLLGLGLEETHPQGRP